MTTGQSDFWPRTSTATQESRPGGGTTGRYRSSRRTVPAGAGSSAILSRLQGSPRKQEGGAGTISSTSVTSTQGAASTTTCNCTVPRESGLTSEPAGTSPLSVTAVRGISGPV